MLAILACSSESSMAPISGATTLAECPSFDSLYFYYSSYSYHEAFYLLLRVKKKEPDHNCKLIWVYNILDIYWMDHKAIEADVKNYKIREGPLYKRSKFLKEWRERWIVLTTNYLYTFTSKSLEEVTDILDLK